MLTAIALAQFATGLGAQSPAPASQFPDRRPQTAAHGPAASTTSAALVQTPSADQMASFYPPAALRKRETGRAVIRCRVAVSGLLSDCRVASTSDSAFDAATLRIAPLFRLRPATRNGEPVASGVDIPVVWTIAGVTTAGPSPQVGPVTRRRDDCPGAETTDQENDCLSRALGQAEALLDRYRTAAQARVSQDSASSSAAETAETPAAFAKAERAWAAYQDAECAAVFDNWSDGSIRIAKETGCRIELSRLHAHVLWRQWLTFEDSTPPTLPEPSLDGAP